MTQTDVSLELPYPPSVNTYWRHVVIGRAARTLISRRGREYRTAVQRAVLAQRSPRALGRLAVRIDVYPPDLRQRDLDNIPKAVLDALTHAGVWRDDSQIDLLQVVRREAVRGGRVLVRVTESRHAVCQRELFAEVAG